MLSLARLVEGGRQRARKGRREWSGGTSNGEARIKEDDDLQEDMRKKNSTIFLYTIITIAYPWGPAYETGPSLV